jgi:hypothetical protein
LSVPWVEVFAVFLVCHLVGDFLLQSEWQAVNKAGGLGGDPTARRALLTHVAVYTFCFVPALVWLADDLGAEVLAVAAVIFATHLVQDDRRLLAEFIERVKGHRLGGEDIVSLTVDQSFHVVILFAIALWAGA